VAKDQQGSVQLSLISEYGSSTHLLAHTQFHYFDPPLNDWRFIALSVRPRLYTHTTDDPPCSEHPLASSSHPRGNQARMPSPKMGTRTTSCRLYRLDFRLWSPIIPRLISTVPWYPTDDAIRWSSAGDTTMIRC